MYLPVPSQPDCATAWREAVRAVDAASGHQAYNVIIDVADPVANATIVHPGIAAVDAFLTPRAKPIDTVANTIFPASLYLRHGAPAFFDVFATRVLPKVKRGERWSGYYFERMTDYPVAGGNPPNQLWDIVTRMKDDSVKALNKFELSLFDPVRDVDNSPYGGQCLSFLSFKIVPGTPRIHVEEEAPAAMFAEEAECRVALKDGVLPEPQRATLRLIACDELADVLQEVEWEVAWLYAGEQVELERLPENPGGDAFFDQCRAGTVLRFVDLGSGFSLHAE